MDDNLRMEVILTQIKQKLDEAEVELCSSPYYTEDNCTCEEELKKLANEHSVSLGIPVDSCLVALLELQQHALVHECNCFNETDVATIKVSVPDENGTRRIICVQTKLSAPTEELQRGVAEQVGVEPDRIKLIWSGDILKGNTLSSYGVQNGSQIMAVIGYGNPTKLKIEAGSSQSKGRKRARNSGDGSDVTQKKQKSITFTKDFRSIVTAREYVDKSLLIYKLFNPEEGTSDQQNVEIQGDGLLITAPRRFGKTVNMDMIKCFLEIQDKEQKIPLCERSNYKLFNGLKIMGPDYKYFVKQYFGKYPVIKVDFFCYAFISKLSDAVDFCRSVIKKVYRQHEYLHESKALKEDEKVLCKQWCDEKLHMNKGVQEVQVALERLSEYLERHFNTQVFVLIDEYDSPIIEAVFNDEMEPVQFSKILKFYTGILALLLKNNSHVSGAVVTGISYIAGVGLSSELGCLKSHQFLNNCFFVEYYGFTKTEVDELFSKFHVTGEERNGVDKMYNGYKDKNFQHTIYNPYSVVSFLRLRRAGAISHWVQSGAVMKVEDSLKHKEYRNDFNTLLKGDYPCVDEIKAKISKNDILGLAAISSGATEIPTREVLLSFLLEQGYLSYAGENSEKQSFLKIPNLEIRDEIVDKLKEYYTSYCKINSEKINDCSKSFCVLFSSIGKDDEELKQMLQNVKEKVEALLSDEITLRVIKQNHATLQQILFLPLILTGFKYGPEMLTPSLTRPDVFMTKENIGAIIEIKFNPTPNKPRNTAERALTQIFEKDYVQLFNDRTYFPDSIEYIVMGLSVREDNSVEICCLAKRNGHENLSAEDIERAIHVK